MSADRVFRRVTVDVHAPPQPLAAEVRRDQHSILPLS
jgi:hypothetical protein